MSYAQFGEMKSVLAILKRWASLVGSYGSRGIVENFVKASLLII